jgi:hypothetical protein
MLLPLLEKRLLIHLDQSTDKLESQQMLLLLMLLLLTHKELLLQKLMQLAVPFLLLEK